MLLADVGNLVEPSLTIAENVVVLGVCVGAHAGDVMRRLDDIVGFARVAEHPDSPLWEVSVAAVARLTIAAALECASGPVLLVGEMPAVDDDGFEAWTRERAARLRAGGTATIQLSSGDCWPLGPPDRVLWIEEGRAVAHGIAESVLDAVRARKLGLVGMR